MTYVYKAGYSSDSSIKKKNHTYILTNTEGDRCQLFSLMPNIKETCKIVRQGKTVLKLILFCKIKGISHKTILLTLRFSVFIKFK